MFVAVQSGSLSAAGIVQMDHFQFVKPDVLVETFQGLIYAFLGVKVHPCGIGVTVVRDYERSSECSIFGCEIVDRPLVGFNSHLSNWHVEMPRVSYDSTRGCSGKFMIKSEFPCFMTPHVGRIPSSRS